MTEDEHASHRCDDWSNYSDTPQTLSRVRRLLAALLDHDDTAVTNLISEMDGCTECITAALIMMASVAVHLMPPGDVRTYISLEMQLSDDVLTPLATDQGAPPGGQRP